MGSSSLFRTEGAYSSILNKADHVKKTSTGIDNPSLEAQISREEIFGPVTAVYSIKNIQQGIELANDVPWAFQAAIFTQSLKTAELASNQLNASTVMINEHTAFRADWMPFAGWAASGHDTAGVPDTFHSMTREKMVVQRSF